MRLGHTCIQPGRQALPETGRVLCCSSKGCMHDVLAYKLETNCMLCCSFVPEAQCMMSSQEPAVQRWVSGCLALRLFTR